MEKRTKFCNKHKCFRNLKVACTMSYDKACYCADNDHKDFDEGTTEPVEVKPDKEKYISTARRWNQHLIDIGVIKDGSAIGVDPDDVMLMLAEHWIICETIQPNDHSIKAALEVLKGYNK